MLQMENLAESFVFFTLFFFLLNLLQVISSFFLKQKLFKRVFVELQTFFQFFPYCDLQISTLKRSS